MEERETVQRGERSRTSTKGKRKRKRERNAVSDAGSPRVREGGGKVEVDSGVE
jgi:hypothetical protein